MLSTPQIGKTFAVAVWALAMGWHYAGSLGWWAAPVSDQTLAGHAQLRDMADSAGVLRSYTESPGRLRVDLVNGTRVAFKSWEREQNLSSATVHWMVLDEAHLLTTSAYAILRARMAATFGPLRMIGNAGDVEGEFKRRCDFAADPANAHEANFYRWTWRERLVALGDEATEQGRQYKAFIEGERARLPGWLFRAQYEAEWIASSSAAIPPDVVDRATCVQLAGELAVSGAEGFIVGQLKPTSPEERFAIGWDVAQSIDFTCGMPVPLKGPVRRVTSMMRFHRVDYPVAAQRMAEYGRVWNNAIHFVEVNGPGKPVLEILQAMGVDAREWVTTNESKHDAFVQASGDLQLGRLQLAELPPLQAELKSIRYRRNPSGTYSYAAPEGQHDDTFMSLLIGAWNADVAASPLFMVV